MNSKQTILVDLQTDGLSDSQIRAWLGFLSVFSVFHDKPIRLVLQGELLPDTLVSDYETPLESMRFDRERVIDWGRDQVFIFGSQSLTPGLMHAVSVVRLVPSGPPLWVNHTILDEWRWVLAADEGLAALAPSVRPWRPDCSVLTSLYAGDEYLDGFLADCAGWSGYERLEHFIVRPASPGDEHGRVMAHGRDHPAVVYFWLAEDPGLYEVWNRCARLSTAKYLTNANVDDRRAPEQIERLTGVLDASGDIDVVSCRLRNTDVRNLDWADSADASVWPPDAQDRDYGIEGLFMRPGGRLASFNLPHCMPVWRAGLHVANGYFDEPTFGPSADWEFWLRCGQQGARFRLIGQPLGLHLKRPDSYWRRHDDAERGDGRVLERYTRSDDEVLSQPLREPITRLVTELVAALRYHSAARLFWVFRWILSVRAESAAGASADPILAHVASARLGIRDFSTFDGYVDWRQSGPVGNTLDLLFDFVGFCLEHAAFSNRDAASVYLALATEYLAMSGRPVGLLIKARVHGLLGDRDRERFYLQSLYDRDPGAFWANVQRIYRFSRPLAWFLEHLEGCPQRFDFGSVSSPNRVFYYPRTEMNPYQTLLYGSLQRRGVDIVGLEDLSAIEACGIRAGDVVHVHWLSRLFDERPLSEHEVAFNDFVHLIRSLRGQGLRVYWTVHNRLMHDYPDESRDRGFRRRLSATVDRVFVHHPMQLDMIADWLSGDAKVEITEHGGYQGYYRNVIDQSASRTQLNWPTDDVVMLVAGLIRPYKDLAARLGVVNDWLTGSPRRRLLVAGPVSCAETRVGLKRLPEGQVHLVDRFVDDDELQIYFNAASLVLLSYRDVLTSGSLIEALGFGRPVLAPAMGSIPYYVVNGFNGWLYRNDAELKDLLSSIGDDNAALLELQENCKRTAELVEWP